MNGYEYHVYSIPLLHTDHWQDDCFLVDHPLDNSTQQELVDRTRVFKGIGIMAMKITSPEADHQ